MGNRSAFVQEVAAELALTIAPMVKVEPPMDKRQCAEWLGCGLTHIDEMVAAGMPHRDFAAPGAKIRMLRFWKHELATWTGTAGVVGVGERMAEDQNQKRRSR